MKPWTIGLSTGCFYQQPIFEVLGPIRDSGFDAVEVCSFPRHLDYHKTADVARAGERMREHGLRPLSFHAPFAETIDITALDENVRKLAIGELITACEAAAAMGVENVVLHPGPEREGRPAEAEFLQRMRHAADSLNEVADRCLDLGVHLVLENMLPHLLFGHINDMLYLLGSILNCKVGTCLDTGHANLARELGTVIHQLSGHLHMVHANDNRGQRDDHLPPGEGVIDWQWVMAELHRCGFSGPLILELSLGKDGTVAGTLAGAQRAKAYLEEMMVR